ncbi:ribonuclease R [Mogibacterium pumilum]|uniref:Ribonuclease R n=1 Tax=Mogibacterium pumilum TaxID=86332 RepID=A0A223ASX6_9FIRM|nr:ribonuclease R [Mogibacterium pumilum]ASS38077.1 ribonuclease R [Mogibacterium pumilum]
MSRKRKIKKQKRNTRKSIIVEGKLMKNKRGFGFVCPDNSDDVFVSGRDMNGAMNGDIVRVKARENHRRLGAFEGNIIKIIERSCQYVVGHLTMERGLYLIDPINNNNDYIMISKKNLGSAKPGDVIKAKIIRYPKGDYIAEGKVKTVIARAGDSDEYILSHMADYGVKPHFCNRVINEADSVANRVKIYPSRGRKDYRELMTVTIDGADSKDFDDAISVSKLDTGNYELLVHIADVAEYVRECSALDKEALNRGNSVYLPDRVVPMLPERLSNGECSLNPKVERLTLTCAMEIDDEGYIVNYDISESIIKSNYRLIYDDVSDMLENHDENLIEKYSDVFPMLTVSCELYHALSRRRKRDGSLDFNLPESKIILNDDGDPVDVKLAERRVSNRMIEEFMLAANKTVAEHYFWAKIPLAYRVHEKPNALKMMELKHFLSNLGFAINGKSNSIKTKELSNILCMLDGMPEEALVSRMMIRTMQKAYYSTECLGHYGLAFKYYCHFTSPIRRYADLLVHRTIKNQIHAGEYISSEKGYKTFLEDACTHISETERNAMELERKITKHYQVMYMTNHIGSEFDGVVSSVKSHGIYVELENTIEGVIRIELLGNRYIVDEKSYSAIDEVSGKAITLGQPVRIRVIDASPEDEYIDFELA